MDARGLPTEQLLSQRETFIVSTHDDRRGEKIAVRAQVINDPPDREPSQVNKQKSKTPGHQQPASGKDKARQKKSRSNHNEHANCGGVKNQRIFLRAAQ